MRKKTICVLAACMLLMTGCGAAAGSESGSKTESAAPASAAEALQEGGTDGMDQDALQNLTEDDLIGFGKNFESFQAPAFLTARPVPDTATIIMAEKSASDDASAEALAAAIFPDASVKNITETKRAGIWRLYEADADRYALVWDSAFLDMESMTLKAEATPDNLLLIASVMDMPDGRKLGGFIEDEGSQQRVKLYDLVYEKGEDGTADLVHIYGRDFTVSTADGRIEDFHSDWYFLHQKAVMPTA